MKDIPYSWEGDVLIDPVSKKLRVGYSKSSSRLLSVYIILNNGDIFQNMVKINEKSSIMNLIEEGYFPIGIVLKDTSRRRIDRIKSVVLRYLASRIWGDCVELIKDKDRIIFRKAVKRLENIPLPSAVTESSRMIEKIDVEYIKKMREVIFQRIKECRSQVLAISLIDFIHIYGAYPETIDFIIEKYRDNVWDLLEMATYIDRHVEKIWNVIQESNNVEVIDKYKKKFLFLDELEGRVQSNGYIGDLITKDLFTYSEIVLNICQKYDNDASRILKDYILEKTSAKRFIL